MAHLPVAVQSGLGSPLRTYSRQADRYYREPHLSIYRPTKFSRVKCVIPPVWGGPLTALPSFFRLAVSSL